MSLQKSLVRIAKVLHRIQKVIFGLIIITINQIKDAILGRKIEPVKLDGKVVLISGYNDSVLLGKALRDELLSAGCKVCVTKSPSCPESGLNGPDRGKVYKIDTARYNDMNEVKSSIKTTFGSLDILIVLSPEIPDVDIFQTCQKFPKFVGDAVKSMFWATKCFMEGRGDEEVGQIVIVAPQCDRSDVSNILRRAVLGFYESLHAELLMFHRSNISVTLVKNYRFRKNSWANQSQTALKIIQGLVRKDNILEIESENGSPNGFGRLLIFIVDIGISLKDYLFEILGLKAKADISNQIALVTGGGMGMGREIALSLARQGCNIAVADVDYEMAQKTATELQKLNVKAIAYKADVSNENDIAQLRSNIEKDLGNVDILVNNAGLMPVATILQSKVQTIERTIDINLIAHLLAVKEFLPSMLKSKRGHIVAISSIAGFHPMPAAILYCTTKYGLTAFMDSLQYGLRKTNQGFIKTTTIHPYFTKTRTDLFELLGRDPMFKLLPWLETEYVGNKIVEGILQGDRRVLIPSIKYISLLRTIIPFAARDFLIKVSMTSVRNMKNEGNILT